VQPYPPRKSFGRKLAGVVFAPVRWVVEKCLVLYYVGMDPGTSRWARRALVGAVLYIFSLGIVLDFIPLIGEVDDLLAFLIAVVAVGFSIKPTHVLQARQTARRWFGDKPEPPSAPVPSLPPPSLPSPPPIAQTPVSPQPLTQPPFLPKN
jgi:uncharacterized membrane protein YkvA (DUF1232 family)